ncbi:MAG TPA: 5-(carboxyamino)imidazole ribonucleotide synthase [Lacunisphaera sp.]|nr:5-(carboxyamino)imidazole ribonucleotide synthase [Lacunisphaera sp.]
MSAGQAILPGKTIGVLGGGQLGRMLAQAATRLGYRVHIYEPQANCPAGQVAHKEVNAAYDDLAALAAFAKECDVVTYEFENVPAAPLKAIESRTQLRPHWNVLETCQNRSREKNWLRQNNFPHAKFEEVAAGGDIVAGIRAVGVPCVVKTADFGYDGKGQVKVSDEAGIVAAKAAFAGRACVIEQWIDFACEVSVVMARSAKAAIRLFPLVENIHTNHILDFSIVPARVAPDVTAAAEKMARLIAEKIGLVGVMGVEMFVTKDGQVLVNELAPRTHNSGHYTIDACAVSQFEQQVRAICGLPLGDTRLLSPVVMVNILGDAWAKGEPKWDVLLAEPAVRLHLYGKAEPRPGRKMGHFTVTSRDADMAFGFAQKIKARL